MITTLQRFAFLISLAAVGAENHKQFIETYFQNDKRLSMWKIFRPLFCEEPKASQDYDKRKNMMAMYKLIITMTASASTYRAVSGMDNMIAGFQATYYDMPGFLDMSKALTENLNDKRLQLKLIDLQTEDMF